MRTAVDISMYPLADPYRPLIRAFIDRLHTHDGILVKTNSLSTQIWGDLNAVMQVLAVEMARSAEASAQLVFVIKVLPGLSPPADAVAG